MASLAYVGGIQKKTIYEESTVTETISYTNYEEFFDVAFSASPTSAAFISAGDNNEFIITVKPYFGSSTYNMCILTAVDDITVPFNLYCTAVFRDSFTRYYIVKPDGTQSPIEPGDTTIVINSMTKGKQITIKAITDASDTTTIIQSIQVKMDAQRTFTTKIPTGTQSVNVDKPVSFIYAGVTATIPVYTETTTTEDVALSTSTFTDFFSADNTGTTGTNAKGITWADNSGSGLKLKFGNYGINSSTSMTTFTAQRDLTNVVIKGLYYTESNFDKITLTVAGTTVLNAVSGESSTLTQRWTGSLSKGQTIVLKYVKDSSQSVTSEKSTYFTLSCDPYQKTTVDKVQTGTETKLVDKKIVKGYVGGPDGKARLFFGSSVNVSYTGEYTVSDVTVNSVACKLYTLTGSGTLTVSGGAVQYWMCGGGASGNKYTYWSDIGGTNGGGGGYTSTGPLSAGNYIVTIGAGGSSASDGSATSIGDSLSANGGYASGNGGSGGGGGEQSTYSTAASYGSGEGVSTIPFGLSDLKAHCAGGGGGAYYSKSSKKETKYNGGKGGTDGGNGADKVLASYGNARGGTGGTYGGGNGGAYVSANNNHQATSATFYGSGGGGAYYHASSSTYNGTPGSGYQGVAYVLVPA